MKSPIFLPLLLLFCCLQNIIAQNDDAKLSASIYYPLSLEDNMYKEIYDGILGGGAVYYFTNWGPMGLGAATDLAFSRGSTFIRGNTSPFRKANSLLVQPGLMATLNASKWHPNVGVGYTLQWVFYELWPGREDMGYDTSESYGGVNLRFGLAYDLGKSLFVQIHYDHTFLDNEATSEDFSKNIESISILKAGFGLRF